MDAFVETTAMVDLLFKEKERAQKVRELMKMYERTLSSQYVRMEIKRGVLQYFVTPHNKATECKTFSEVVQYVQRLARGPARNRLSTMLEAIGSFLRTVEQTRLTSLKDAGKLGEFQRVALAAYLRTRIRRFWVQFEEAVDVVLDPVECYKHGYSLSPPRLVGNKFDNSFQNCDRWKPGICRVREFCNEKTAEVSAIRKALREIRDKDEETQKRLQVLNDIVRLPKREISRKKCWHAGDAILVLEAPLASAIINHNCKHFDPLCRAVGRLSVCY